MSAASKGMTYAGLAALIVLAGLLLRTYWDNWPVDLSALYFAAHFYGQGAYDLVYPAGAFFWPDSGTPPEWTALAAQQGNPNAILPPFVYPPVWAALLAPLTRIMTMVEFANAMLVLNVASLVALILMGFDMARRMTAEAPRGDAPNLLLWVLACGVLIGFTSFGMLSLQLGQPQIFVSALMVGALWAMMRGSDLSAGALLALAAAIKLMPAMLAVVFVMERNWRALSAFVLVGAVLAGGSVLITGWPMHAGLLERIGMLDGEILESRLSIGIELSLLHLSTLLSGTAHWDIPGPGMVAQPVWVGISARVILLAGLGATFWATRDTPETTRLWLRFLLSFLFVVLTAPLGWIHYLILPALLLPALVTLMRASWCLPVLLAIASLLSIALFLTLSDYDWAGYVQVHLHVSMVLAVIAVLFAFARETRR